MTRDETTVLFANEAFYAAFAGGDLSAMGALWSATVAVSCIHPGRGILRGRDEVMASWRQILKEGGADIRAAEASVTVHGDCAVVTCFEVLGDGFLAATNLFVREGAGWKLTHHQAGPTSERPAALGPAQGPGGAPLQ